MDVSNLTQCDVERVGVAWALDLLALWLRPGAQVLDTRQARQRERWQRTIGDYVVPLCDGTVAGVEVKTERRHTGNVFIETWSNRTRDTERRRDGWIRTLQADAIVFLFLDEECAYVAPFLPLQDWCLYEGRVYDYPEKVVRMSRDGEQPNVTIGHPAPVSVLLAARLITAYRRAPDGTWRADAPSAKGLAT